MVFPDTSPRPGGGGLRFRSRPNTNGQLGAIGHAHSHSTALSNLHSYTIPHAHSHSTALSNLLSYTIPHAHSGTWGNPQTNANSYSYT